MRIFKILKLAKAYKKAWQDWNKCSPKEDSKYFFKLENAEHNLLSEVIK